MIKIDERYLPIKKEPFIKPVDGAIRTKQEEENSRNLTKRKSDELDLSEFLKGLE